MAALRTMADMAGRAPTEAERDILVRYTGWGGLPQVFDDTHNANTELRQLIGIDRYVDARRSVMDAHYTSELIIRSMYAGLERLGFNGGTVLEPSAGIGHFVGLMPETMRAASTFHTVEMEPVSQSIIQALYAQGNHEHLQAPFQRVPVIDGYYDAVVGNPPFGNQHLHDPDRTALSKAFSIHNYFFAKSMEALRPGGVMAMVVSHYLLDAHNSAAREFLAARATLLAAFRLPNTAFKENALTEVTTDILFFQRKHTNSVDEPRWLEVADRTDANNGGRYTVNRYFEDHPEHVLGRIGSASTAFGWALTCELRPERTLEDLLRQAVATLPANVYRPAAEARVASSSVDTEFAVPANLRPDNFFLLPDGRLAVVNRAVLGEAPYALYDPPNLKAGQRIEQMIEVRNALLTVFELEENDAGPAAIESARSLLNRHYDQCVSRFGYLNSLGNRQAFGDDAHVQLLLALESNYDPGVSAAVARKHGVEAREPSAQKAAIFQRRMLSPRQPPQRADTPEEALTHSLAARGKVDLDYISALLGRTNDEAAEQLKHRIIDVPGTDTWELLDTYLTGNVRSKLDEATKLAQEHPAYERHVTLLTRALPPDIAPADISIKLGSPWVPGTIYEQFARKSLQATIARVVPLPGIGKFGGSITLRDITSDTMTWGTQEYPARKLFFALLNTTPITVHHEIGFGDDKKMVIDHEATAAAQQKAAALSERFREWVWSDPVRRTELAARYNTLFNTEVKRRYDGGHLRLTGLNPSIVPRPSQRNAIWRGLIDGNALYDHVVGAGKTYVLGGVAVEGKRLGLHNKPMISVPNHLLLQWRDAIYEMYPQASVLVADKKDFTKDRRQRLLGRIATNDWDVVLIAHSSFERIPLPPETEQELLEEQIQSLTDAIQQSRNSSGESLSRKQLERMRERFKERLEASKTPKDTGLHFGQLGIDALLVDESHLYKNLFIPTSLRGVSGLGDIKGSQKAFDMFIKVRYLQTTHQRGTYFATGTPLSNTLAEIYTQQRYFQYDRMKAQGIVHFDAWCNTFAEQKSAWELDATGVNYALRTRFAKFTNVPELVAMYHSIADVVTNADLKRQALERGEVFAVPALRGGAPESVIAERHAELGRFIGEPEPVLGSDGQPLLDGDGQPITGWTKGSVIDRMEHLPADPRIDNPLKITSDARKAGLDMRLIDPHAADPAGAKVNLAVANIVSIWREWDERRGTQLVFCDLSTPKFHSQGVALTVTLEANADGDSDDSDDSDMITDADLGSAGVPSVHNVYDDIRDKLVAGGIPLEQIRYIHDAKTDLQKSALFKAMNAGTVRVLLGSTSKMGAGTNVQRRLVAIHHLDAPWRPSDLTQRDGRGLRQGNYFHETDLDFEFRILRYATRQTYDARMWQVQEQKSALLEQFRQGDGALREIDDIASDAVNAAEMKASASGNPLILYHVQIERDLKEVEAVRRNWERNRHTLEYRLQDREAIAPRAEQRIAGIRHIIGILDANPSSALHTTSGAWTVADDQERIHRYMVNAFKSCSDGVSVVPVGTWRGLSLSVQADAKSFIFRLRGGSSYLESDNLSYRRTDLAYSVSGFFTRLDNIARGLEQRIADIERIKVQELQEMATAEAELAVPFPQQDRLHALQADLQEVLGELRRSRQQQGYVSTWVPSAMRDPEDQVTLTMAFNESAGAAP